MLVIRIYLMRSNVVAGVAFKCDSGSEESPEWGRKLAPDSGDGEMPPSGRGAGANSSQRWLTPTQGKPEERFASPCLADPLCAMQWPFLVLLWGGTEFREVNDFPKVSQCPGSTAEDGVFPQCHINNSIIMTLQR